MRTHRVLLTLSVLALGLALSGCETFDPENWFNPKKPLPGERRQVFPEGVPGVPQGVPPELVQGYQPPPEPEPAPAVVEKPKPKPKRVAQPAPRPQVQRAPPPQAQPNTPPPAQSQTQSPFPDPPRPGTFQR